MTNSVTKLVQYISDAGLRQTAIMVANAVLVLAVCYIVRRILMRLLKSALARTHLDRGVSAFARSTSNVVLWAITIILVVGSLGVDATSLIALLSVIGLAVSLAIQGILSNLAGGILLLISKPFVVDDYVEAGGTGGTVTEIGLVYTTLTTVDNKVIYIPNSEIASEKITNYSAQDSRMLDLRYRTDYSVDPELVKTTLLGVVSAHPRVQFTPEPLVRVWGYQDNAAEYVVRVWCATADYWEVYYDLQEQIWAALSEAGVAMSFQNFNVKVHGGEK